jgi:hypothetical protein
MEFAVLSHFSPMKFRTYDSADKQSYFGPLVIILSKFETAKHFNVNISGSTDVPVSINR